jgi:hypothetical protein
MVKLTIDKVIILCIMGMCQIDNKRGDMQKCSFCQWFRYDRPYAIRDATKMKDLQPVRPLCVLDKRKWIALDTIGINPYQERPQNCQHYELHEACVSDPNYAEYK